MFILTVMISYPQFVFASPSPARRIPPFEESGQLLIINLFYLALAEYWNSLFLFLSLLLPPSSLSRWNGAGSKGGSADLQDDESVGGSTLLPGFPDGRAWQVHHSCWSSFQPQSLRQQWVQFKLLVIGIIFLYMYMYANIDSYTCTCMFLMHIM